MSTASENENPAALVATTDKMASPIEDLRSTFQAMASALAEKRALHAAILDGYPSAESYAGFASASLASMADKGVKDLYWQINSMAHPKGYELVPQKIKAIEIGCASLPLDITAFGGSGSSH